MSFRFRHGMFEASVVFDVQKVVQDTSDNSEVFSFGGDVRNMQMSPDSQRLAISFKSKNVFSNF